MLYLGYWICTGSSSCNWWNTCLSTHEIQEMSCFYEFLQQLEKYKFYTNFWLSSGLICRLTGRKIATFIIVNFHHVTYYLSDRLLVLKFSLLFIFNLIDVSMYRLKIIHESGVASFDVQQKSRRSIRDKRCHIVPFWGTTKVLYSFLFNIINFSLRKKSIMYRNTNQCRLQWTTIKNTRDMH